MQEESDKVLLEATRLCQDEREIEAEALVKKQMALEPGNLKLMTMLGVIQARLCKDNKAESTFRTVLSRDPNYEDAICGLGRLLDQSLRIDEAEELYIMFLQNNPGHFALEDLCRLLISENRVDEALKLARNHATQYETNPYAFNAIRYALHVLEDQLENELNDDRENELLFTKLIENIFEQLELVEALERIAKLPKDKQIELDDDKTRLIGELDYLIQSAPSRNISVSSEIQDKIEHLKRAL
ncbi:MAG: hypothetical protein ACFFDQ_14005 [Candidatus Thorarchaeota archaeon]